MIGNIAWLAPNNFFVELIIIVWLLDLERFASWGLLVVCKTGKVVVGFVAIRINEVLALLCSDVLEVPLGSGRGLRVGH